MRSSKWSYRGLSVFESFHLPLLQSPRAFDSPVSVGDLIGENLGHGEVWILEH